MDVIKEKWEEIIQKLKVEYFLSNISFETWIRPLEVYEIRGNTLYLTVNFKASIEHIQNKYLLPLKVCIAEVTGTEYQIKFIPRDLPREQQRRYLEKTAPVKEKTHKHKEVSPIAEKANLNPKYTFDTFVVGGNNNFAHAASLAVAESPGDVGVTVLAVLNAMRSLGRTWQDPSDAFDRTLHTGPGTIEESPVCDK